MKQTNTQVFPSSQQFDAGTRPVQFDLPSENPTPSIRQMLEAREEQTLHPLAAKSAQSRGRAQAETPCELRTDFQRDRDRILHSKAFRRLNHKTQVFISPMGDHYRTRLTHSLEVSQVARTIARALCLNEDLTETIALAHDLGHPPFGHSGEHALDELFKASDTKGFHHQKQSLRIVETIERLNLTREVLNGISPDTAYITLEAQIVDTADRIAYLHHDVEDALRAGLIQETDIPADILAVLGQGRQARLSRMISDMVTTTRPLLDQQNQQRNTIKIQMSDAVNQAMLNLRQWMFDHVYLRQDAYQESTEDIPQSTKVYRVLNGLKEFYLAHPDLMSPNSTAVESTESAERRVLDFIAGMTDRYAIDLYKKILLPNPHHRRFEDEPAGLLSADHPAAGYTSQGERGGLSRW